MARESFSIKLQNTILDTVKEEIEIITEDELVHAKKRIELRIHNMTDAMVFKVVQNYTLEDKLNCIKITVNKKDIK